MSRAARSAITTTVVVVGLLLFFMSGLSLMPVKTGSMRPELYPGDVVIGVRPSTSAPEIGDVVVATPEFVKGGERMPPIAHRIIGKSDDGRGWVTQGDFNPEPDAWTVYPQDVQRVMIAHLPVKYVQSPIVIVVAFGLLALVWLWPRTVVEDPDEEADASMGVVGQGTAVVQQWPPQARWKVPPRWPAQVQWPGHQGQPGYPVQAVQPQAVDAWGRPVPSAQPYPPLTSPQPAQPAPQWIGAARTEQVPAAQQPGPPGS